MLKNFFTPRLSQKTIKPKKKKRAVLFYNPSFWRVFVFFSGTILLLFALTGLLYLYLPLTKAFLVYRFSSPALIPPIPTATPPPEEPMPTPTLLDYNDFYISIPKIKANAQVFPHIPVDKKEVYLSILQKGVAHAHGSAFPGMGKTIYLFAHSTNTPINVIRYNAVFFLLNQLNSGDTIILSFSGQEYHYQVFDKKIVAADEVEYLYYSDNQEVLILQTCWPPGTIWKRLLLFAKNV